MQNLHKDISVMLVDDDSIVLESLIAWLEDHDFQVCGFTCPQQALQLVKTTPPDVCLVDLRLAGTNGEELVKEIRVHAPSTRCLIYSGSSYKLSPDLHLLGLSQNDVLQKPITDFELLLKKITGFQ